MCAIRALAVFTTCLDNSIFFLFLSIYYTKIFWYNYYSEKYPIILKGLWWSTENCYELDLD